MYCRTSQGQFEKYLFIFITLCFLGKAEEGSSTWETSQEAKEWRDLQAKQLC